MIFIEAKKYSNTLEDDQVTKQLCKYAFEKAVSLAVITNGKLWKFYLPDENSLDWKNRLFYTINTVEQDIGHVVSSLQDYLTKDKVISGDATENARVTFQPIKIQLGFADMWNNLLRQPNEYIIEGINVEIEKRFQYEMDSDGVKELISKNISLLQVSTDTQNHTPTPTPTPTPNVSNVMSNHMDNEVAGSEVRQPPTYPDPLKLNKHETEVTKLEPGTQFTIELKAKTNIKYHLIPLKRDFREYFPGYEIRFDVRLENNRVMRCKVTSAPKDTPVGDKTHGSYIKNLERSALQNWYRENKAETGDALIFEVIEHHKIYKMALRRQ